MLIGKLLSSIITPVKRVRADGSKKMTLPIRRADVFEMSEDLKNQKQAYGILSRNDKFSIDSFRSLSEEENLLLRNVADIDTKTAVNLSKKWKTASFEEKRAVCSVLINRIIIDVDGSTEIVWNI